MATYVDPYRYGDPLFNYVTYLPVFQAADGATIVDASQYGATTTKSGGADIVSNYLDLNGSTGYVSTNGVAGRTTSFGSSSWCAEFILEFDALPGTMTLGSSWLGSPNRAWELIYSSTNVSGYWSNNGSGSDISPAQANLTWSTGVRYHVAMVRNRVANNTVMYIDGLGGTPVSSSLDMVSTTAVLDIGRETGGGPGIRFFNGKLHGMRISVGTPRYTGNFTPPTSFPTFGS